MKSTGRGKPDYQTRLAQFLSQIDDIKTKRPKEDLYAIMDTVPFRDLETALMMARLERETHHASSL
jgi:hypothetical protein